LQGGVAQSEHVGDQGCGNRGPACPGRQELAPLFSMS